jgi:predicted secreted protein
MPSIAKLAMGSLLKIGDGASPTEVFTTVPEVYKLTGPSVKFDLLDVTSHDTSGLFREWLPGLSDGDMISFTVHWRPSNTVHKNLRIDSYAATRRNFKIVYPDTSDNTVQVSTFISELSPVADVGPVMEMSGRLKITGAPSWT